MVELTQFVLYAVLIFLYLGVPLCLLGFARVLESLSGPGAIETAGMPGHGVINRAEGVRSRIRAHFRHRLAGSAELPQLAPRSHRLLIPRPSFDPLRQAA